MKNTSALTLASVWLLALSALPSSADTISEALSANTYQLAFVPSTTTATWGAPVSANLYLQETVGQNSTSLLNTFNMAWIGANIARTGDAVANMTSFTLGAGFDPTIYSISPDFLDVQANSATIIQATNLPPDALPSVENPATNTFRIHLGTLNFLAAAASGTATFTATAASPDWNILLDDNSTVLDSYITAGSFTIAVDGPSAVPLPAAWQTSILCLAAFAGARRWRNPRKPAHP